jgi:hypothetical protein
MNRAVLYLLFAASFFTYYSAKAINVGNRTDSIITCDSLQKTDSSALLILSENPDVLKHTTTDSIAPLSFKAKKRIAAILAFPVPFGLLGLHRLFLGAKPYIPFVYVGTVGGCFLILPLVDFIAILSADEETFKRFENNPRVFMWSR